MFSSAGSSAPSTRTFPVREHPPGFLLHSVHTGLNFLYDIINQTVRHFRLPYIHRTTSFSPVLPYNAAEGTFFKSTGVCLIIVNVHIGLEFAAHPAMVSPKITGRLP